MSRVENWMQSYELIWPTELSGSGEEAIEFSRPGVRSAGSLLVRIRTPGRAWLGSFARGDGRLDFVGGTPSPDHFVVIAGGSGYLVNAALPASYQLLPVYPIKTVGSAVSARIILVADDTEIVAVDERGIGWRSGRVSSDGIDLIEINESNAEVRVWNAAEGHAERLLVDLVTGRLSNGV